MKQRVYGKVAKVLEVPNLKELQVRSYREFLQAEIPPHRREDKGLEAILREIFPIESYNETVSMDYVSYDLRPPRYTPDECRKLRLTYGMPFKVRVRLNLPEPVEEEVYIGELPKMIGGGEFIINGVERVIVNQLHRSPGVDFSENIHSSEKRLHTCRIIPERGSWIELEVTSKDLLRVRIDQSGKFPATCLLRAFGEAYSTDEDIIRLFYDTQVVKLGTKKAVEKIKGHPVVGDVVDTSTGEILLESGQVIPKELADLFDSVGIKEVEIITKVEDMLILNTLAEDTSKMHEEAIFSIYSKLRPGYPPEMEKAMELFSEKFTDEKRYNLGRVGRFRINRKFNFDDKESNTPTLRADDYVHCMKYIMELRAGRGYIDDIDHLGNRRVRTLDELAGDQLRRGLLRMKRVAQERMGLGDKKDLKLRNLVHYKPVATSIEGFFGRGELSQIVDQTNPLAQLTHERRLSALGPGGLNRKRAGFEVRDVHVSHYGRICPIETPEGTNIGLISSLAIYAKVDAYGFLVTAYRVVKKGKLTDEVLWLRADQEQGKVVVPADTLTTKTGKMKGNEVLARKDGDFLLVDPSDVEYADVSPKQLVGVSASLIPFLEHDDANRALMGSNMQRQAVPLLRPNPPLVATGMEAVVARNSGMVVVAEEDGEVTSATADRIVLNGDSEYIMTKFRGLTDRTCLNHRPLVKKGDKVKKGEIIADGAATRDGELALGQNVLVAFMPFDGYNFEDAILISEQLVVEDTFTSVHIEEFEVEVRDTELGREEVTADVPNVSRRALANLREDGIIRLGTTVIPGDILVGKVAPKSKTELTPEEKLLRAIFGKMGEEVKNESLTVPPGVTGVVIDAQKFSRKSHMTDDERKRIDAEVARIKQELKEQRAELVHGFLRRLEKKLGGEIKLQGRVSEFHDESPTDALKELLMVDRLEIPKGVDKEEVFELGSQWIGRIEDLELEKTRMIDRLTKGDQLPPGVLELIKVYVATKRKISVGDKMAGRHGNKGVVAKIMPVEDMPFLADGTAVEILLNPLGVPSRMNVGQILETHLGWAASQLGFQAITPVFDGTKEEEIREALNEAGLPEDGKVTLYDGRTGEPFEQQVTVGQMYLLKLHHMVDDKIHARATGPYSLITQQPLGGKARFGGQRFGEMEVWALEAYGAAYILQELLTVKSDDVDGRAKIYESMVKGENLLEPGTPVSFEVLTNEIKGLGLDMELEKRSYQSL